MPCYICLLAVCSNLFGAASTSGVGGRWGGCCSTFTAQALASHRLHTQHSAGVDAPPAPAHMAWHLPLPLTPPCRISHLGAISSSLTVPATLLHVLPASYASHGCAYYRWAAIAVAHSLIGTACTALHLRRSGGATSIWRITWQQQHHRLRTHVSLTRYLLLLLHRYNAHCTCGARCWFISSQYNGCRQRQQQRSWHITTQCAMTPQSLHRTACINRDQLLPILATPVVALLDRGLRCHRLCARHLYAP